MNAQAKQNELRRKTNPVFNDRKLKLGTFCLLYTSPSPRDS